MKKLVRTKESERLHLKILATSQQFERVIIPKEVSDVLQIKKQL